MRPIRPRPELAGIPVWNVQPGPWLTTRKRAQTHFFNRWHSMLPI